MFSSEYPHVYAIDAFHSTSDKMSAPPDFPGENPGQDALVKWLDAWDTYLASAGYAPMLAGRDPSSVSHLVERDLSSFPAPTADMSEGQKTGLLEKRAEILYKNEIIRKQKAALLKDLTNRLAHKLIASLRPHAGLRLRQLQQDHIIDGTADQPDATYDGVAMYKTLVALRTAALSKVQRDEIKQRLKEFEAVRLADGCTVQEFSDKVNYFIRDINPYLTRQYRDEELGEYIIELLPSSRTSDGLALMREMRRDNTLDDHVKVTAACNELVAAHAKSSKKISGAPPVAMATSSRITAKEMRKLLAGDPDDLRGALQTRAVTETALAVLRSGGGRRSNDRPNDDRGGDKGGASRLPEGQKCPSGTCTFNHKGECWRDPRVRTAPKDLFSRPEQVKRIESDRQANAARMQVPYAPLRETEGGAASAAGLKAAVDEYAFGWGLPVHICAESSTDIESQLDGFGDLVIEDEQESAGDVKIGRPAPPAARTDSYVAGAPLAVHTTAEAPVAATLDLGDLDLSCEPCVAEPEPAPVPLAPPCDAASAPPPTPASTSPRYAVWSPAVLVCLFLAALVGAGVAAAALSPNGLTAFPVMMAAFASKTGVGGLARLLSAAPPTDTAVISLGASTHTVMSHIAVALATVVILLACSPEMRAAAAGATIRHAGGVARGHAWRAACMRNWHAVRAGMFSLMVVLALAFLPRGGASASLVSNSYSVNRHLLEQHNVTSLSPMMSGKDLRDILDDYNSCHVAEPLYNLTGKVATGMAVADSGAAVHAAPDERYAISGTKRRNTTIICTANGQVTPQWKVDMKLPIVTDKARPAQLLLKDVLLLDDCPHILVSLGRLAEENGIGTWIAPHKEESHLAWRDPRTKSLHKVSMLNMGVLTIPLHEAGGVCASVTRGAKNTKTVPGDIIHKRYLHRHADVLARLPRCAHDVPDEWASAVRSAAKTPCDHCLHSSADAQPSSHKAPDVTAPGDLISYDVWEVGVGHVHGGQRKVINFHDHYSRINKPYLIHKYSDAPAAIDLFLAWCKSHKVTVRHMHTDNGTTLCSQEVRDKLSAAHVHLTTIAPNVPRQNGVCERQWRTLARDTRGLLSAAKMPRSFWWYASRFRVFRPRRVDSFSW